MVVGVCLLCVSARLAMISLYSLSSFRCFLAVEYDIPILVQASFTVNSGFLSSISSTDLLPALEGARVPLF